MNRTRAVPLMLPPSWLKVTGAFSPIHNVVWFVTVPVLVTVPPLIDALPSANRVPELVSTLPPRSNEGKAPVSSSRPWLTSGPDAVTVL